MMTKHNDQVFCVYKLDISFWYKHQETKERLPTHCVPQCEYKTYDFNNKVSTHKDACNNFRKVNTLRYINNYIKARN